MTISATTFQTSRPDSAMPRQMRLRHAIAAIALGMAAFSGMTSPAAAAEHPWDQSCAYKVPNTTGNGYSVITDSCNRLRSCQRLADQGGNPAQAGCYGFVPAAPPAEKRS